MNQRQRPTYKYYLEQCEDSELREKLEMQFAEYESLRRLHVEAVRAAQRAAALAAMQEAQVQLANLDFLIAAGNACDLVNTEPVWLTRRDGAGKVLLECVLTQTDIHNTVRAQAKQMRQQSQEINGDPEEGGDDGVDLFGTGSNK